MYTCPFCKDVKILDTSKEFKDHVKRYHEDEQKSGHCPLENCSNTFDSIYNYIQHVDKYHVAQTANSDRRGKKRKNSVNDRETRNNIIRTLTSSDVLTKNNSISGINQISSTEKIPDLIDLPYSDVSLQENNDILIDDTINQDESIPKILSMEYFEEESPFDLQLLDFKKRQSDIATQVVVDLLADVTLSRSIVQKIVSTFVEYQRVSIEELRKIDPQISENRRIDVALKFMETSFSDIDTEHKAFKHLSKKEALIRPISKVIDTRMKPLLKRKNGRISLSPVETKVQIVPMDLVLTKFLELPNVFDTIMKSLDAPSDSHRISSIVQSESWRKIKSQNPEKIIIPLSIYFDDFEINNPLGPHKKKIGGIYYTISCIPPEFSSKLEYWFLAQFHREEDYKRLGNKKIFGKFKNELAELKDNGIEMTVDGVTHRVFFRVCRILGDNLGLNQMLGFVTCFNAEYYCRICTASKQQCQKNSTENRNLLRNKKNYASDVKIARTRGEHCHGVKDECIFSPLFHFIDLKPLDPFHDFNDGACRYEVGSTLNLLMTDKTNYKLNLIDDLNTNIKLLNIPHESGVNIPSKISEKAVKDRYVQLTGSEMAFMMEYLGILIGKYIRRGDKIWQLYVLLRKIFFLVMAPYFTQHDVDLLRNLIQEHHELYLSLNIGDLKPKHHFFLHYPLAMINSGPQRYNSAIRGEAVHRNSIRYAKVALSRTDPCYTLAMKYQLRLAKKLFGNEPMMDYECLKIKKKMLLKGLENFNDFKNISSVSEDEEIELISSINYNGTQYKAGMAIMTDIKRSIPVFAEIKYVIKANEKIYFVVNELNTSYLDEHVQAYVITETKKWLFVEQKNLVTYMPSYPQLIELPVMNEDGNMHVDTENRIKLEQKKVIVRTYI